MRVLIAEDVVVTDRAMPEMNGLELAAAIGQIAGARPAVIMLSGFGAKVGVSGDLPSGVLLRAHQARDPRPPAGSARPG